MARTTKQIAPAFLKRPHKPGCKGDLYRRANVVHIDRAGRIENGGWVAHDYVCNRSYDGCPARVLVTEVAVRSIAVSVEA